MFVWAPASRRRGAGTEVEIVTVTCKVNSPVKLRIVLGCLIFQLEGKCQILLYVWIWQIIRDLWMSYNSVHCKKDLSCGFSIDLCYKMPVFRDAVPVKVYDHLDIRVFLQVGFQIIAGIIISGAAVQFTACHVKLFFEMDYLITVVFCEKLCQIISYSYNRVGFFPFSGICKGFLRMAVIDQNLRGIGFFGNF